MKIKNSINIQKNINLKILSPSLIIAKLYLKKILLRILDIHKVSLTFQIIEK